MSKQQKKTTALDIEVCPGTLATGFTSYSPAALRRVFEGRKVNHLLAYLPPETDEVAADLFQENVERISISGYQDKVSVLMDKNKLRLTGVGEQGQYILKPIPVKLKKRNQVPANEHLTMQIAEQVYGIRTAANAMVFFQDGTPAYLTKRFDVKPDGTKWGKEDFATLAGKSRETGGTNFKYDYSYEEMAVLLKKYAPAYLIEVEKFFVLVLFNYLFSNGDAHLKNFSLLETPQGDHILSPAYDLLNTRIHVNDTDFALSRKLFVDDFQSAKWKQTGHAHANDFKEFAKRIGIRSTRIDKLMMPFLEKQVSVEQLINVSFLNTTTQKTYWMDYNKKRNFLTK